MGLAVGPDWANPLYARAMVILRALRRDLLSALFRYRSTQRLSLTPRRAQVVDSLVRLACAHRAGSVLPGLRRTCGVSSSGRSRPPVADNLPSLDFGAGARRILHGDTVQNETLEVTGASPAGFGCAETHLP